MTEAGRRNTRARHSRLRRPHPSEPGTIHTRKLSRAEATRLREEAERPKQIRKRIDDAIGIESGLRPPRWMKAEPLVQAEKRHPGRRDQYDRAAIRAVAEDVRKTNDHDDMTQKEFFATVCVECAKHKLTTPAADDRRTWRRYIGDLSPTR